ncbi:MAG TPA: chromosome segregation protein SMC [Rugosibacter sp.]|nr:chromosome segregation protein SMC [Rugosibacter sp.]
MRLIKLKIAGFKSFVEPTVVLFPSQLAGVVGPNGCGKSNIIDAVRWVLGESKASELRGESIQDVIFKGSGHRKPVSRASVELFFDNGQGRASGQWSQYAEITVKRVLDREGNSSYYINNLHVRRRDMIDLFLGTGLGPRAYAIIGQGMISRIVEAKPDELRFFLEEAAGVTKYKERRKETENRLEDARENLARVDDICNELESQVTRLQAQAEVAKEYQGLHEQIGFKQSVLWLKKRNDARRDALVLAQQVSESTTQVTSQTTALRHIEAQVEQAREAHFTASDLLHATQAEMYAANGEVSRLEAELTHVRDARTRLESRLAQLASEDTHWTAQNTQLIEEQIRWAALLDNARNRLAIATDEHALAVERLTSAEEAVRAVGHEVAAARREQNQFEQAQRLAEADRGHAQRALENLTQRRTRLDQDRAALGAPDSAQLAAAEIEEARSQESLSLAQAALHESQMAIPAAETAVRSARETLQLAHRQLTESRAQHGALVQLQAKVAQRGDIGPWLDARGLAQAKPLWQSIQVNKGWKTAVEAVLRENFTALAADATTLRAALENSPPVILALAYVDGQGVAQQTPLANPNQVSDVSAESLRAQVQCDDARWSAVLDEWLGHVMITDDLPGKLSGQFAVDTPRMGAPRVYVSRAGHLLTASGITLYVPDAKTHGVIERQREIDELAELMDARSLAEQVAREAQQLAEQHLAELQSQLATARRAVQEAQQAMHVAQVTALKLNQAQARFDERSAQIDHDLLELARQQTTEETRLARAELESRQQQERLDIMREQLDQLFEAQRQKDAALRDARQLETQLAREVQEANFSERECLSKLDDNTRATTTAASQLARVSAEMRGATTELASISDEILQAQLHHALDNKRVKESALAERRDALETAAAALRGLDEQRLKLEQGIAPLNERINQLKLKAQAAEMSEAQFQERLTEINLLTEADEAPFIDALAASPKDSVLQSEITRLTQALEALGPVNLAALEELTTAAQRKEFLDEQSADLTSAINTLEDAIRRIDRDTREQLQETYNIVNAQFGTLFPQLFGGGEARLILTGDEILDAGIQIMAQPPGKKNSTIHLLSGGEKALTAIALVFAMFQLNPAPFCMLDEVDAPLDDSNTVRFCEMVKRMSVQTQFIFISHNKIAMEMAQQLIGVTMQEQGVSRVVEVDISEALRLADEQKVA